MVSHFKETIPESEAPRSEVVKNMHVAFMHSSPTFKVVGELNRKRKFIRKIEDMIKEAADW